VRHSLYASREAQFEVLSAPRSDARPRPFRTGLGDVGVMREPRLLLAAGRALLMQAANPLVAQGANRAQHLSVRSVRAARADGPVGHGRLLRYHPGGGTRLEPGRRAAPPCGRDAAGCQRDLEGVTGNRIFSRRPDTAPLGPCVVRRHHAGCPRFARRGPQPGGGGTRSYASGMRSPGAWGCPGASAGRTPPGCAATSSTRCATARLSLARALVKLLRRSCTLRSRRDCSVRGTDTLAFIATGLLPSQLRRGYGLTWTPAHSAAFAALTRSLRVATPAMPRRLRISPVYDVALARSEGRWPDSRAA